MSFKLEENFADDFLEKVSTQSYVRLNDVRLKDATKWVRDSL